MVNGKSLFVFITETGWIISRITDETLKQTADFSNNRLYDESAREKTWRLMIEPKGLYNIEFIRSSSFTLTVNHVAITVFVKIIKIWLSLLWFCTILFCLLLCYTLLYNHEELTSISCQHYLSLLMFFPVAALDYSLIIFSHIFSLFSPAKKELRGRKWSNKQL